MFHFVDLDIYSEAKKVQVVFISHIQYMLCPNYKLIWVVFQCHVVHSYSLNEPPLTAWVSVKKQKLVGLGLYGKVIRGVLTFGPYYTLFWQ